jgi:hypothetical protein
MPVGSTCQELPNRRYRPAEGERALLSRDHPYVVHAFAESAPCEDTSVGVTEPVAEGPDRSDAEIAEQIPDLCGRLAGQQDAELGLSCLQICVVHELAYRHPDGLTPVAGLGLNQCVPVGQVRVTQERPGKACDSVEAGNHPDVASRKPVCITANQVMLGALSAAALRTRGLVSRRARIFNRPVLGDSRNRGTARLGSFAYCLGVRSQALELVAVVLLEDGPVQGCITRHSAGQLVGSRHTAGKFDGLLHGPEVHELKGDSGRIAEALVPGDPRMCWLGP